MKTIYIAHENQLLISHLKGVSEIAKKNAAKIDCGDYGELLGLLHDIGKYSDVFQSYIKSAIGSLGPDIDEDYVDAGTLKGKIDHSTAGAQYVWKKLIGEKTEKEYTILAQILSLCLVSHHSGLIDCLATDLNGVRDNFTRRIQKNDNKTHSSEVGEKMEISDQLNKILSNDKLCIPLKKILRTIHGMTVDSSHQSIIFQFQTGLLIRFLFSCLIDADRQDSADSEKPHVAQVRQNGLYLPWNQLAERVESKVRSFGKPKPGINEIRADVSRHCLHASKKTKGLFSLTVPTGGGKTLASLRFALNHAEGHQLDRIIYVVPFTSIIDQNARETRKILETNEYETGRIVLEHHSNIGAEKQSWKEKILTDNWDAPVIFTTMVQFLESFFGGGTRGARRMHQLAKSVIIFDEIQSIPIRCVHMFCNAVNFLIDICGSSVVLCTATQPLLGNVDKMKGALNIDKENEIIPDVQRLFDELRRVEVIDNRKQSGWRDDEIADLAMKEMQKSGSCLVIVNMKRYAHSIFSIIKATLTKNIFHLSTGMCPEHRKKILTEIKKKLGREQIICVSTQLIEAGVDIDFGSVIRFNAGLDSITQAAGRCNRNGEREIGRVHIVNPTDEKIDCLKDIAIGKEKCERVLSDYKGDPAKYNKNLLDPSLLKWYYENYFYSRENDMDYPVSRNELGHDDSLLRMLSNNKLTAEEFGRVNGRMPDSFVRQSFMTANEIFKSIDAPTQSVIVRFEDNGERVVNDLCAIFEPEKQFGLLREAQQYSVSLFPHEFKKLTEQNALYPVQEGTEIFYLDSKYYNDEFGISFEPVNQEEFSYV